MYRIMYNDRTIFDPYGSSDEVVTDASLQSGKNASTYLDFTMAVTHPLYDVVAERDGSVKLYWDSELLFEGVIESIETDIELNKTISCIGPLDYLNDTVVRPYSTVAGEQDLTAPSSIEGYFKWLIDQHNSRVLDSSKVFQIGVNQGASIKDGSYIYASSTSYPTTASELTDKILDSYGGYLFIRYEDGSKLLDLYADVHDMNAQIIDFGENITDFTKTSDTKDQYTALIVQGGTPTFENGDFEDGYSKWNTYPGMALQSSVVHGGNYASYFNTGIGEYVNDSFFYFTKKYRYKATVWIKNERNADVTARASYQINIGTGWQNFSIGGTDYLVVPNDGDWHEFSVDFLPSLTENTKIRPRWYFDNVGDASGGAVYVDDFDFKRIDGDDTVPEDPIDLSLIPDGVTDIDSDIIKSGDVVYSASSVLRYGYKEKTYSDDSLTDIDKLITQAVVELRKLMSPYLTIDVKAVDLSLYMEGYSHLRVGQAVRVRSVPHNVDEYLVVDSIELDLNQPDQTEYVLGIAYDSLTGQQSGYLKSLNASINHSLDSVASLDQSLKDQAIQIGSVESIANNAQSTADSAIQQAGAANQAAQDAQNTANQAAQDASKAEQIVSEVQQMVDEIDAGVEQAKQDAANAAEKADSFQQQITDVTTSVDGVIQDVDELSSSVAGAVSDSSQALTVATQVQQSIDSIQSTASSAYENAQEALNQSSTALQTAQEITTTVQEDYLSKDEAGGLYSTKTELQQTSDAITAQVEQVYDESVLLEEADGPVVQIGENAGLPPESVTVYGQTRQNLWSNPSSSTKNGVTIKNNEDGSITISGTNTSEGSSGTFFVSANIYTIKPNTTYTVYADENMSSDGGDIAAFFRIEQLKNDGTRASDIRIGKSTTKFKSDENLAYIKCVFASYPGNNLSGTYRIMLNEGSEAQSWCPPGLSSVNSVEVATAGKNLMPTKEYKSQFWTRDLGDAVKVVNSLTGLKMVLKYEVTLLTADNPSLIPTSLTGAILMSKDGVSHTSQVMFESGFQIGMVKTITYCFMVDEEDRIDHFYTYGCGHSNDSSNRTNGTADVRILLRLATEEDNWSKGTIRTANEPISDDEWDGAPVTFTEIPLLGNELRSLPDGTRDELHIDADGEVTLTKRVGVYDLDPNDLVDNANNDTYYFSHTSSIFKDFSSLSEYHPLCDVLKVDQEGNASMLDRSIKLTTNGVAVTRFIGSDLDGVKAFFNGGGQLLGPIEEEQTLPLGKVDLPALNAAGANVWVVASDSSGNVYTLEPDIHVSWYGKNANVLGRFTSKAELEVTADSIRSEVAEEYLSLESAEDTYATKTSVSTVEQTVDGLKSTVSSNYTTLNDKFANYYTKTQVDQRDDSIKLSVSSNLDISVEGENLSVGTADAIVYTPAQNSTYYAPIGKPINSAMGKSLIEKGGKFCLSFDYKAEGITTATVLSYSLKYSATSYTQVPLEAGYSWPTLPVGTSSGHVSVVFQPTEAQKQYGTAWLLSGKKAGENNTGVKITITNFKLEKGDKETSWTPSSFDTADKISSLEVTVDGIEGRVSDAEGNISSLEQTSSGLELRLTQAEKDVDTAQSTANTANSTANTLSGRASQTYSFGGSSSSAWVRLGTLKTGMSDTVEIAVFTGIGYNGLASQNSKISIVIRDGNHNGGAANRYGVTVMREGNERNEVQVRSSSYGTCEVWVHFAGAYANGSYTISKAADVTWTHSGTVQAATPTSGTVQSQSYLVNGAAAAKTATNYLKFDSSGLCVGNMTGTLGYNTLIKSTGVDIRNGSTVLASFGASEINLGKNSTSSALYVAGGSASLRVDSSNGNRIEMRSTSGASISNKPAGDGSIKNLCYVSIGSQNVPGVKVGASGYFIDLLDRVRFGNLGNNVVSDIVIAQGKSGEWTYRRWSSGIQEAWLVHGGWSFPANTRSYTDFTLPWTAHNTNYCVTFGLTAFNVTTQPAGFTGAHFIATGCTTTKFRADCWNDGSSTFTAGVCIHVLDRPWG